MIYKDVINLGFKEKFINDNVYMNRHGFQATIISLKLSKNASIYWHKELQNQENEFEFVRYDKKGWVLKRKQLTEDEAMFIINLFINKKEEPFSDAA